MSRAKIDALDDVLLALLGERAAVVAELWAEKDAAGVERSDPAREAEIFARLRARASEAGLDPNAIEAIFRQIVGKRLRG